MSRAQRRGTGHTRPSHLATLVGILILLLASRTRYVVGRDAKVQALIARLVPDRARDRLRARFLRLPDRP